MSLKGPDINKGEKTDDQEKILFEKRQLIEKLKKTLIDSHKNKNNEEIEFLLKRL